MKSVKGYLEILDKGFGFLRSIENNFIPNPVDPFIPTGLIKKFQLREGSLIEGTGVAGDPKSNNLKLDNIETINGIPFEESLKIEPLWNQTSINPDERLHLTQGPEDLMGKALDIVAPIGKGQRGLIVSPPKSGKTTIMRHMANSIVINNPDIAVFVLLVDERPEEVTDFKRGLQGAHVLFSSSDQTISHHMRMTRMAMHTAIRCAEAGQDTVVFIDSLTRMSRAFNVETNSHGRTMSGGLGANALEMPRKIFGAARNIENGGSLTVIATILVETGSRMDDIIFQEFKGTGNMELVLSRKCAEQRIFPAININQSGTRKEELLLSKDEYDMAIKFRRILAQQDEVSAISDLLDHIQNRGE
ncbi:MAG: transcription termination factor Rho [Desulfobacterales bacterium]|nr:transcription termination factor Rho [Desulfobacterales bacterium]